MKSWGKTKPNIQTKQNKTEKQQQTNKQTTEWNQKILKIQVQKYFLVIVLNINVCLGDYSCLSRGWQLSPCSTLQAGLPGETTFSMMNNQFKWKANKQAPQSKKKRIKLPFSPKEAQRMSPASYSFCEQPRRTEPLRATSKLAPNVFFLPKLLVRNKNFSNKINFAAWNFSFASVDFTLKNHWKTNLTYWH